MEEVLANEYGWTPTVTQELNLWELIQYTSKIKARNEEKTKEELVRMKLFTIAMHGDDPESFIQTLDNMIQGKDPEEVSREDSIKAIDGFKALVESNRSRG